MFTDLNDERDILYYKNEHRPRIMHIRSYKARSICLLRISRTSNKDQKFKGLHFELSIDIVVFSVPKRKMYS